MNRIAKILHDTNSEYIKLNDCEEKQVNDVRLRVACISYMMSRNDVSVTTTTETIRKECTKLYDTFDMYRNGTNKHNHWRNKIYSLHEYYKMNAPSKKNAIDKLIVLLQHQIRVPTGIFDNSDEEEQYHQLHFDELANTYHDEEEDEEQEDEDEDEDEDTLQEIKTLPPPTITVHMPSVYRRQRP